MPLHKSHSYDGRFLLYSIKLAIVEQNCAGCPYLQNIKVPEELADIDGTVLSDIRFGCIYPEDIKDFNPNLREPFLTLEEIAGNGCLFWSGAIPEGIREPDEMYRPITNEMYCPVTSETYAVFSEHCGVLI